MSGAGWLGSPEELLTFLEQAGAERDDQGNFLIAGAQVIQGMDGDLAVPAETVFFKDSKPVALAASMPDDVGVRVRVL